jgi:hypothetical protein
MVHAVQAMVYDSASLPRGLRAKQREVLQGQAAKLETLFRQGEAGAHEGWTSLPMLWALERNGYGIILWSLGPWLLSTQNPTATQASGELHRLSGRNRRCVPVTTTWLPPTGGLPPPNPTALSWGAPAPTPAKACRPQTRCLILERLLVM